MGLVPTLSLGLYLLLILLGVIGGVFHMLTRFTAAFGIGVGILGIVVMMWIKSEHFALVLEWLLS
ncbi:hypothetical protein GIY56_16680 [Paracoccus sp. YIM 132242]|uniref:Uncharacterized protein n=1 Tax=Paracoccus lichenicola TaxID=2665644 RepID=A0A6L6HS21_9RHOB|nr:hypothetical protein [Paracoccus lichenicola]MTE01927.1 hypothetical protein [Paracoccus lichenicola]